MTLVRIVRQIGMAFLGCVVLTNAMAKGQDDIGPEWPKQITRPAGEIVIYQPQLESFDGNGLTARAAVAVTPTGADESVYGAIWLTTRVSTNREERTVTLRDLNVTEVKFAHATPDQVQRLSGIIEDEFGGSETTISLDRVLTMLELIDKQDEASSELAREPPAIIFVDRPAMLVTIDGPPKLSPVGGTGIQRVMNSPFFIALDPGGTYYLTDGMTWYQATQVDGPWRAASGIPEKMMSEAASAFGMATERPAPNALPEIIMATEATELIVTEGAPRFAPIEGTGLMALSNADADVFLESSSRRYFVLLSGRWFASTSLDGGWAWVPFEELPEDFSSLPTLEYGGVLASVPGTQAAADAFNDAAIPQTAMIDRSQATLTVEYDGEPQFEPIDGTLMTYAVNTSAAVIQLEGRFYCCDQGVWFEADDPHGPWALCTNVPEEFESIPPSCPLYYVQYVEIYDYDDDVVYVGYYPGYYGYYWYRGALWYGTGWRYRAWLRHQYVARPTTYGHGFRYDRYAGGWRARARHGDWIPRDRQLDRVWGPGGYRGEDTRRENMYDRPANVKRTIDPVRDARALEREAHRQERARLNQQRQAEQAELRRELARERKNNVYADRNGNIHRRTEQGWERRDPSGWSDQRSVDQYLNREYDARLRGAQRTYDYQRSRGFQGGGGRRGGRR